MKDKILIILTSHRVDCFYLCMQCLKRHTDINSFKAVYILANEVSSSHNDLIQLYKKYFKNIIDIHCSPRGLSGCVIAMQNLVLDQHRNDIIIKIDEDVFVTKGWLQSLSDCYERNKHTDAILFTPLIPNNFVGRIMLEPLFKETFPKQYTGDLANNTVHQNNIYGVWIWDKVINKKLVDTIKSKSYSIPDMKFNRHLNINCIMFDNRLIDMVFPFHISDEAEINNTIEKSKKFGIMTAQSIVHHYSFGPQQESIDKLIGINTVSRYLES